MTTLTSRQSEILDFIKSEITTNQRPPTVRGIGNRFGIRSPNGVLCHLKALERKGLIERDLHMANGIRLVGGNSGPKWMDKPNSAGLWLVHYTYAHTDVEVEGIRVSEDELDLPWEGLEVYGPIPEPPIN